VRRAAAFALLVLAAGACADPTETTTSTGNAPDELEIRCDGETTEVLTPTVQAQRDGVHVLIHNSATERLSVTTETRGDGASPGDTTLIFPIPPGRSRIRCMRETDDNAMANGDWGDFEVLAVEGWISPALECPGGRMYTGFADYVAGARGVEDPLVDSKKHFRLEGSVVEAGYDIVGERTYINVSEGHAKESLVYTSDGSGGWLQTESSGCSD
jgi:hypothetical protein